MIIIGLPLYIYSNSYPTILSSTHYCYFIRYINHWNLQLVNNVINIIPKVNFPPALVTSSNFDSPLMHFGFLCYQNKLIIWFPICCLWVYQNEGYHRNASKLDIHVCVTKVWMYIHGQNLYVFIWHQLQCKQQQATLKMCYQK